MSSCKKEFNGLSTNANEVFWLSNAGADMPVWVKGNTASKIMILFLHGGPGDGSYRYSGFQTDQLWKSYAVAYWDQRDAGAAAGNSNYNNLSLDQMINDLQKLVVVLKYRYGGDLKIFLMGHSFGALLGCGYLINADNQKQIQGWIEVDGAHDYPESNALERQMLIDSATVEIGKGKDVEQWSGILEYCTTHQANSGLDISLKIDNYASRAEGYVNPDHSTVATELFSVSSPVSFGVNLFNLDVNASGRGFLQSVESVSLTDQLSKITLPSLLVWGQYDFLVPVATGNHALNKLGSGYKRLVIMPHSGHIPMNEDPDLFAKTVSAFIEAVR